MTSPRCSVSSSGSPAAGSSSRTSRGPADDRASDLDQAALAGAERADPGVRVDVRVRRTRSPRARPGGARPPLSLECSWIIATLSNTDSSSIACSVWNVRRTPHRARRKCAIDSRSSPNAVTLPPTGLTNPLSTLKNVVLPAPLGPISPHVPLSNLTLILSSGVTPPNRTVRSETSITARRLPGPMSGLRTSRPISRPSRARSLGNWSTIPRGAVVSTWSTPTPNRIVSQSGEMPQLVNSAGQELQQEARPRSRPTCCRRRPSGPRRAA